jgi:hypothetical protein
LVVKNGSKTRCRIVSSIPTPVSSTARQTYSRFAAGPSSWRCSSVSHVQLVSIRRMPPSGMASRALFTRLNRICSTACRSTWTSGRSSSASTIISMSAGRIRRRTSASPVTVSPTCAVSRFSAERRAKLSSWLTIMRPLTAADTMSRTSFCDATSGGRSCCSSSALARITVNKLVKSCAIPERGVGGHEAAVGRRPEDPVGRLADQEPVGLVGQGQRLLRPAPLGDVGSHPDAARRSLARLRQR